MPYVPPPDLATLSLAEIAALAEARRLPPVEQWNPEATADSLMVIRADGRWFHDGGEIRRPAMIRAFAGLLRREADGQHWIVPTRCSSASSAAKDRPGSQSIPSRTL